MPYQLVHDENCSSARGGGVLHLGLADMGPLLCLGRGVLTSRGGSITMGGFIFWYGSTMVKKRTRLLSCAVSMADEPIRRLVLVMSSETSKKDFKGLAIVCCVSTDGSKATKRF